MTIATLDRRIRNLAGYSVNGLVVLRYVTTRPQGASGLLGMAIWECRCTLCGHNQQKSRRALVAKKAKCAQCSRRADLRILGQRFGRLAITALSDETDGISTWWEAVCDCGKRCLIRRAEIVSGDTRSCGCLADEKLPQTLAEARRRRHDKSRRSAPTRPRSRSPAVPSKDAGKGANR